MKNKKLSDIYKVLKRHFGPQYWWPADSPFEVIVGAILTQNTAWHNVEKAVSNIKSAGLLRSPRALLRIGRKKLSTLIKPAGFHNLKSKRLTNFLDFLSSNYNSDLNRLSNIQTPELRAQLLNINGIGPETCDSILLYAFGRPVFVIDAYTKRVFSRLGLTKETDDYCHLQAFFMSGLPKNTKLFNEYHALIVKLAKEFCRKKRRCVGCPVKSRYLACK